MKLNLVEQNQSTQSTSKPENIRRRSIYETSNPDKHPSNNKMKDITITSLEAGLKVMS